jgi:hypothetical protein
MKPEVIAAILGVPCIQDDEPDIQQILDSADMVTWASGTEAQVIALIAERQSLGISKYKTTVRENPLTLREWLNHALCECLDQAIYLKRAIEQIDALEDDGK